MGKERKKTLVRDRTDHVWGLQSWKMEGGQKEAPMYFQVFKADAPLRRCKIDVQNLTATAGLLWCHDRDESLLQTDWLAFQSSLGLGYQTEQSTSQHASCRVTFSKLGWSEN